MDEQKDRKAQQGPRKLGRRGKGRGMIPKKEDSSVTLGKFMKSKIDAVESTVKKGGMGADRVLSKFRNPERAKKFIKSGGYRKDPKDAAYYKSIGLTGERGDKAVKDFFKPEDIRMKNIMAGEYNKGGRVGLKSGSKGCKLAMKGKGRAYGKNS